MQTIRVRLFARFRDVIGTELLNVEVPAYASVSDLRTRLGVMNPSLITLLARSQIAVNNELASDDALIHSDDEVALIPPVSGGLRGVK